MKNYFKMDSSIFVIIFLVAVVASAKDYCQYKCFNGAVNLACKHPGKPDKDCVGFKRMDIGAAEQKLILNQHNNYRSLVAKGKAKNESGKTLPAAKNMNELEWDDDLAYLAYLNVLQCKMKHDKCRDTNTQNGQNLFTIFTTASYTVEEVLKQAIDYWFDEIKNLDLSEIKSFRGGSGKKIGHASQVIWAKTTRVGCAVSTYKHGIFNAYLTACNYVYGNLLRTSIYEAGNNCEKCKTCTSLGLCRQ